ncbi:Eco57I restriction-modification methylase domain-containing protein [Sphingomonas sp.]|jgi:hypothetical protein|uniref:Eco57I restriction-modification methylase domain-containing protein n=1 Tax=Sphingomonas sp. TaxID=28214 RepID=UPI002EDA6009
MPLFNEKTIAQALASWSREPSEAEREAAAQWAALAAVEFNAQNESQLEPEFNAVVMQRVLGYRAAGSDGVGTIKAKQPIGGGIVDLALGAFTATAARVIAPVELKGPKVPLDAIMAGRAKTPVQQAWEYAMDAVGARWVLVSNMRELRLYAVGHGRTVHERFDLKRIAEPAELTRLQMMLHADQLLSGGTADLLARSASEDRDITGQLYADFRSLRDDLLQFVRDQRAHVGAEARITLVQKLLDRIVFIAFAEDGPLLPDDSLRKAVEFHNPYDPQPRWTQVKRLFDAVDKGAPPLDIPVYNGGLFASDPAIDALDLPDHLVERFLDIAKYDFASQVSVTILGHIFEQSISDIEALRAEAIGQAPPKTTTRKRFGVVYTPDFVTRFIVEQTIGRHLAEIAGALMADHADGIDERGARGGDIVRWRDERGYWRAYLDRLTTLRIVDPACGSGAFLIAAFDVLLAEQRRVRNRLGELGGGMFDYADPNSDAEIITRNLYGVDVNAESVEITKLALWLKTAKRGRPLETLELNIRSGNSLIEDSDVHQRAFVWKDAFPQVFEEGGFDIVLGNPPYVAMGLIKDIKPYLARRYAVAADRADLYAYFFELGVRILRPGGRLGYISSSTFFRTGSGVNLRRYLADAAAIETVVDFGDLQVFEGVTTYPAIVTLRRDGGEAGEGETGEGTQDDVRFLNVRALPADLSLAFREAAEPMPRARLTAGSWRFEGDRLDAIRAKMAAGRPTLAQVYGAPLYGIKTGLNEAFVLSREERDALVARDARSADLLKPFLIGENLKRWHVESDDLWLIYTPKNRVDIQAYPAVRDHLLPHRARLEARATKQEWWELQQAQAAYAARFAASKIVYCDISNQPTFSIDRSGAMLANTAYFLPTDDADVCALTGSRAAWFFFSGLTNIAQNGYLRLRTEFVGQLPVPTFDGSLAALASGVQSAAEQRSAIIGATLHRLADIDPRIEQTAAFRAWPDLPLKALRALIAKRFRGVDVPLAERDAWEAWYEGKRAEVATLGTRIADAQAEIDDRVYRLFALDPDERAMIEESLAGR